MFLALGEQVPGSCDSLSGEPLCSPYPLTPLCSLQGLAFRKGTHQLYSTSHDRSVKVWNAAENSYVETL